MTKLKDENKDTKVQDMKTDTRNSEVFVSASALILVIGNSGLNLSY